MNRRTRPAIVLGGVAVALLAAAGTAAAAPPANGHDCAGAAVSSLATSSGGIGPVVRVLAQSSTVDNLGLANCGQPPRANP